MENSMITIILLVSRADFLERVFASLEISDIEEVSLLVYVDGGINLFQKVKEHVRNCRFKDKRSIFRGKGIPSSSGIRTRRARIADIHNEIKMLPISTPYVFLLEDDTIIQTTCLKRLLEAYGIHPHAGLITGLEVGRWGIEHLGAWRVDDIYEPKEIKSIEYKKQGIEEIDGSGFYCMMTRTDLYKKHDFKPFETILGPDFNYGITLRQQGYKNYVVNDVVCKHLTKKKELLVTERIDTIEFIKKDDWELKI